MSAPDVFPFVWLALVATLAIVNPIWAVNDLRQGSARLSWHGARVTREEEPFEYWLAVIGKFAALPFCGFMFWFGLDMLQWGNP